MPTPLVDFLAGYASGAVGILIGNPLDIVKVRIQNGGRISEETVPLRQERGFTNWTKSALRGVAAPVLGYGALNALLFGSYSWWLLKLTELKDNGSVLAMNEGWRLFWAGTLGSYATVPVSVPTELIKCRAQLVHESSLQAFKDVMRNDGIKGLFKGTVITAIRDSFGYGIYFGSYGMGKKLLDVNETGLSDIRGVCKILFVGGMAGCLSWASIFPLDVIKTRYQADVSNVYSSSLDCARRTFALGTGVLFGGLGVTMIRAFGVNAVQFLAYEVMVDILSTEKA
ncbi:hypothetical protein CANCADRAFT_148453 [Tortispora caseinolytica NRRL Y-17796]|uniref:Mitochondrial carrier protein n=1 Tax=Tortispora caseinolytica NRRL Y-17796 TaxID=767744 RepID=A0A1E4TBP5_9ASCO|nr:hypothetical protein CANCADRAFT_148453 [Tortispora caseinolytica NRRL Y-17796]